MGKNKQIYGWPVVLVVIMLIAMVICGFIFNDSYVKGTKANAKSNKDSNAVSIQVTEPIEVNDTTQPPDSVQIVQQSNNGENSSKKDTVNGGNGVQSSSSNTDTHNGRKKKVTETSGQTTIIEGDVKYNIEYVEHVDHIGD